MKRRALFKSVGAGLVVQAVSGLGNANAKEAGPPRPAFTVADYEPFKKIAAAKGAKITINAAGVGAMSVPDQLHLDMDMVRASLALAIRDAQKKGRKEIADKLERLAKSGTAVQQVEFVMGTGTYYFPEDIEKSLNDVGKPVQAAGVQCVVCDWVCTTVCSCLGNGDQACKDRCRNVCSKYC
jgi:hypothetical protein